MIFSFLNVRKKTAAVISGIAIAIASLWGLSMWQDISWQELQSMLLASVFMLGGIILAALLLIVLFALMRKVFSKLSELISRDD